MKYLSNYTEKAQSQLFEELGVFFAFNEEQLKEGLDKNRHILKDGEKFVHCGSMGMIMPRSSIEPFETRHASLIKEAQALDLAENGREGILERELGNYEIGYAYDGIDDPNFRDGISGYGFSEDEIKTAYRKHMANTEY